MGSTTPTQMSCHTLKQRKRMPSTYVMGAVCRQSFLPWKRFRSS